MTYPEWRALTPGEHISYHKSGDEFWELYCRESGVFCGMGYLFGYDDSEDDGLW